MRWVLVVLLSCGGLAARQFRGPDGSPDWWRFRGDPGQALQAAGERCPGGYDVRERDGGVLVVRCKGASGERPQITDDCRQRSSLNRDVCAEQEKAAREWSRAPPTR